MSPFTTSYGLSTSINTIAITTFISGVTTNPTPDTASSYARYQAVGNLVQIEYKYVFATTGTTGAMSINLPLPISTAYPKPQSIGHIRYIGSSTGQVHPVIYNERNVNSVNIVASTTFGGIPVAFTNLSPNTGLGAGDILTGLIIYETG